MNPCSKIFKYKNVPKRVVGKNFVYFNFCLLKKVASCSLSWTIKRLTDFF